MTRMRRYAWMLVAVMELTYRISAASGGFFFFSLPRHHGLTELVGNLPLDVCCAKVQVSESAKVRKSWIG